MESPFNKFIYFGFLLLGAYFAIFQRDYSNAAINLGIALAFDPFDQKQTWKDRPTWQKAWLIVHLACVAMLFGLTVGINDR
jgi:hypothetical protein